MSGKAMRIGLGTTVWAQGEQSGHLDGIGVYTRALWRSIQVQSRLPEAELEPVPYAFGRALPVIECGRPRALGAHFSVNALLAALARRPLAASARLRGEVDLFHATDHHIPRIAGVPVVASVMDLIPLLHPEWVSQRLRGLKNWLFSETIRNADHLITISEYSKQDLIRHLGIEPKRISVTPLGVDPTYFVRLADAERLSVLQRYGIGPGFFLFVGTLQPRKNLERVLRAHQMLPAKMRRQRPLVVVGRNGWGIDHLLPALQALEQRGEGRWLSYLPQRDVLALLQSAGALVFPSLYEGFGLPVIEAFAAKCPVIASNSTSLPEVAGEAAWLVEPLDEASIAQAMQQVVGEAAAQERVERGYQRAQTFTWDACAEQTLAVYAKVLGRIGG